MINQRTIQKNVYGDKEKMIAKDITVFSSEQWDEFVMTHENANIFHSSKWLDAINAVHNQQLLKVGLYKNDALVGVIPLFVKSYLLFSIAASPLIVEDTPYLGMVIADEMFSEGIQSLQLFLIKRKIRFLRIIQDQRYYWNTIGQSAKFIEKHTHVLDLEDTEKVLWNNMTSSCRNKVRKALKNEVTITIETSVECIEVYYDILERLYLQQGIVHPNPKEFYRQIWNSFHEEAMNVMFARYMDIVIACVIIVHEGNRSYYLNGASLNEYKYLCPSNLLQWEAIKLAKNRGSKMYDFVGSDIERLARFKKSFGGTLMTYSCLEWSSSPLVTFFRDKYPTVKHLFGQVKSVLKRPFY